ncbi:MAG: type IV toxin-antitoxin system AbiEi family antitoxin domain-containing protein [Iphinoe sp. HA4291-MV1]|jgi:excisionase family DNA binding protein|nr:type IV toxin-antitoxin system AbiEi family antitoxin domain-containing protein [Iphinoe sp. HA4291-MV1]
MVKIVNLSGAYISTDDLAALNGWTYSYVSRLAKEGKIPGAIKFGRDYLIPCHPETGDVQINTKYTRTKSKTE